MPLCPGTARRTFSDAAKYFGDLVPVLIARDREEAQEGPSWIGIHGSVRCSFADDEKQGPER